MADDHLRALFDAYGEAPAPSSTQRETARGRLHAAMRDEPSGSRLRLVPTLGWTAAAAVAAAVVAFVLVVPGSTPQVDANLANIAAAARTVEAAELPEGAYVYFTIESIELTEAQTDEGISLVYRLPTTQEVWVRSGSELRRTTAHPPLFESVDDERAYYASDLPASDGIGETRTLSLTDILNETKIDRLSYDPGELWQQLFTGDAAANEEAAALEHIAQLLRPRHNASPSLRAALIEVMGRLDVQTRPSADGGAVIVQFYEDAFGSYEQTLRLDAHGYLTQNLLILRESFVDPDFPTGVVQDISYSRPLVVAEPGQLPAG